VIALLPGSRPGEALRHMPHVADAAERIHKARPDTRFLLALPHGFTARASLENFRERFSRASVQVIEGQTWDVLACADLALAASGTVTVEAAVLGLPMVTFYRVTWLSWVLGRPLVRVPFYTMVNLIAGRRVVPEIMQGEATGPRLAAEVLALLNDDAAMRTMRTGIAEVCEKLSAVADPMDTAADIVESYLDKEPVHVP
jgi:lipid-A-disaccharide synthase